MMMPLQYQIEPILLPCSTASLHRDPPSFCQHRPSKFAPSRRHVIRRHFRCGAFGRQQSGSWNSDLGGDWARWDVAGAIATAVASAIASAIAAG